MTRLIVLLMLLTQLSGCAGTAADNGLGYSDSINRASQNSENVLKLKFGMPKAEVMKIMGTPGRVENHRVDNRTLQVLFYPIQEVGLDLADSGIKSVPFVFENGILIGWGEIFYGETIEGSAGTKQEMIIERRGQEE